MRTLYTICLFFVLGATLYAQTTEVADTIARPDYSSDPWATLDLTGSRMKPALVITAPPRASAKKKFPLWLPLGGGLIVGGGVTYLLLNEEAPPDPGPGPGPGPGPEPNPEPDSLIVRDDTYTIPCLPPFTIRPLENDEGSGLRIGTVGPTGSASVTIFGTDALIITELGTTDAFTFTINVLDSLGNSATSDIFITIDRPDLSITDDSYTTALNSPVTGNVLNNDTGEGLRVIGFEPPNDGGTVLLDESGQLTFTPSPDFVGTVIFPYTIEDDCEQRATAEIIITIIAPDCNFTTTLTPTATDCGLENGTITTSIDPAGDYSYNWSNGSASSNLDSLLPGEYTLTITSNGGFCADTLTTTITQLPYTYLTSATPAPANCTGGGELTLELAAPDDTPLTVTLTGPTGTQELTLPPGSNQLSELINLLPGTYTLDVYPQNAGTECSQQTIVILADNTPQFLVMNEAYTTPFATPVSNNFLLNDTGLDLVITSVSDLDEGVLVYNGDGTFTFTPAENFTGLVSFTYLLTDACGQTATGSVTITVEPPPCDFTVQMQSSAANCGMSDGNATAVVSPEGNYDYQWSNGMTTATIEQLPADDYQVTVTSNGGLCEQVYAVTIQELPADYITSVTTTPGTCLGSGNIEFTLVNPAMGNFTLTVTGPTGTQEFSVPPGATALDDFLEVAAGNYTIGAYPEAAGVGCSQFVSLGVADETPDPIAVADAYTTEFQTSIGGNVLLNDSGLQLLLIATDNEVGGVVSAEPSGAFTFVPIQNFTGTAGFTYIIEDGCGQTATTAVTIEVGAPNCEFTVELTTSAANCGFADGSAMAVAQPEGATYSYEWSNGATDNVVENLTSGIYMVTVTSNGGLCSDVYSAFVPEISGDYFNSIVTTPGDCTGGGNIILELSSPDSGLLDGSITGPGLDESISLPNGFSELDDLYNLRSGTYTITVYPQLAGPGCGQEIQISIPDNTPPLSATGDSYVTPWQTSLSGNVLTNDNGLDLTLSAVEEVSSGSVSFNGDGSFTFTPVDGFAGLVTFIYTAQDACGSTIQAQVNITVEGPDCDFTVSLTTINAVCGLNTGSISTSITPMDTYDYLWSTGATTASINDLAAGAYGLTVTSNGGFCTQEFSDTIFMAEAQFVDSLSTAPGDCAGNGSIILEAYAPDDGSLVVIINGPSGSSDQIIPSGTTDLGTLVNLPSGTYDLVVYPESIGSGCSEETFAIVEDNSPPTILNDDNYMTGFQVTLIDNVLTNDEGLLLQAVDIISSTGGTVELNSNGDFIYTPDNGFSGTATFVYSAVDACTNVFQATVTIEVGDPDCIFSATFTQIDASCGSNNGSITPNVSPAGDQYTYEWSTGLTTEQIGNLTAGEYSLVITDTVDNCPLAFSFIIEELPVDYLRQLSITPPDCNQAGEVTFDLDGDPPGLYTLDITAPNGTNTSVTNLDGGQIQLSDYVPIISGIYTLSAYNQNIGTVCTDTLLADVPLEMPPQIALVSIIQPSSAGAMDGSFTFEFTQLTVAPYEVFVNGQSDGLASGISNYTVDNLGSGDYTVSITDGSGCISNTLNVTLASTLLIQAGWAPATTFATAAAGEPFRGNIPLARFSNLRPYLQVEYAPRSTIYRWRLGEAFHYGTGGRPVPVLHSTLQLGGRSRSGQWQWGTGLGWLADPRLGSRWETTVAWAVPYLPGVNLQFDGGVGRINSWNFRIVWKME